MRSGPRNPFLTDSGNAMAHGRCDQQDNTPGPGPEGPTDVLDPDDIQYAPLGPGHFGGVISGRYPDGRRVIWSNGRQIASLAPMQVLHESRPIRSAAERPGSAGSQVAEDRLVGVVLGYATGDNRIGL